MNLFQRALLSLLAAVQLMPLTFCLLRKIPQGMMPHILGYAVERVATVELKGMTIKNSPAPFTSQTWWSGTFQHYVEVWYRENFGFRRPALRLYNQLLFNVFRSPSVDWIMIGRHDVLYNSSWALDACGFVAPMPQAEIERVAADLGVVQRHFARINKPLVVLITPSKALTLPEDIPHRFCPAGPSGSADYRRLVSLLERVGVRFVDGQAITWAQKGLSDAPLFPKGGIHWGDLPKYKVTDAVIAEINRFPGYKLRPLKIRAERVDTKPHAEEVDLLGALNLARPNDASEYLHIDLDAAPAPGTPPTLTLVGGSFGRGVIEFLVRGKVFEDVSYFFYYILGKQVWSPGGKYVEYPMDSSPNFAKEIVSSDVVVLEMNVSNIRAKYIPKFLDDALLYFSESRPDMGDVGKD